MGWGDVIIDDWDYEAEMKYLTEVAERARKGEIVEISPAEWLQRFGCVVRSFGYDLKEKSWRLNYSVDRRVSDA